MVVGKVRKPSSLKQQEKQRKERLEAWEESVVRRRLKTRCEGKSLDENTGCRVGEYGLGQTWRSGIL